MNFKETEAAEKLEMLKYADNQPLNVGFSKQYIKKRGFGYTITIGEFTTTRWYNSKQDTGKVESAMAACWFKAKKLKSINK